MKIVYAPHFEAESKALGATADNIRAGTRLMELVAEKSSLISVEMIQATNTNPHFRPWQRVKAERSAIRVVFEATSDVSGDDVFLVHVVAPRFSDTYEEIKALWKQYRTRITPPKPESSE